MAAVVAIIALVLHAQMNRAHLEGLRQRQDIRVRSHEFLLSVLQCLLKGSSGLQTHASCDTRLLCSYDIDCGGVHFGNVSAGHHGEAMERMKSIAETVFPNIFFICREIFAVSVHICQRIHVIMLEHLI